MDEAIRKFESRGHGRLSVGRRQSRWFGVRTSPVLPRRTSASEEPAWFARGGIQSTPDTPPTPRPRRSGTLRAAPRPTGTFCTREQVPGEIPPAVPGEVHELTEPLVTPADGPGEQFVSVARGRVEDALPQERDLLLAEHRAFHPPPHPPPNLIIAPTSEVFSGPLPNGSISYPPVGRAWPTRRPAARL
jgi:hypothetical protein